MTPLAIKTTILLVLSGATAWIMTASGGWDMALQTLLCVMGVDIITGVLVAIVWKKSGKTKSGAADSHTMWQGLCRKSVIILIVFMFTSIDRSMNLGGVLRMGTILFFTGNEGLSVVENVGLMGVPLPAIVINALEQLKKSGDAK